MVHAKKSLKSCSSSRTKLDSLVVGTGGVSSEQTSEVQRRPERVDVLLTTDAPAGLKRRQRELPSIKVFTTRCVRFTQIMGSSQR